MVCTTHLCSNLWWFMVCTTITNHPQKWWLQTIPTNKPATVDHQNHGWTQKKNKWISGDNHGLARFKGGFSEYLRYVVDHNLVKMWIFLNIWDTPCCCNVLGKMMINYWILDAPQFGENPHGCASKTSWAHFILFWTLNHLFWVLLNFAPHQHPMTDHLRVVEQHTVIPNWCWLLADSWYQTISALRCH